MYPAQAMRLQYWNHSLMWPLLNKFEHVYCVQSTSMTTHNSITAVKSLIQWSVQQGVGLYTSHETTDTHIAQLSSHQTSEYAHNNAAVHYHEKQALTLLSGM